MQFRDFPEEVSFCPERPAFPSHGNYRWPMGSGSRCVESLTLDSNEHDRPLAMCGQCDLRIGCRCASPLNISKGGEGVQNSLQRSRPKPIDALPLTELPIGQPAERNRPTPRWRRRPSIHESVKQADKATTMIPRMTFSVERNPFIFTPTISVHRDRSSMLRIVAVRKMSNTQHTT
jgi:hypothetical protein